MNEKTSAIFGLALFTGCSDPVIGEWNLVAHAGYPTIYTYNGCTITRVGTLQVSEGLDADLIDQISSSSGCYYGADGINLWAGDVFALDERRKKKEPGFYRIDLATNEDALQLQCTLDAEGRALDCRDHFGIAWNFE